MKTPGTLLPLPIPPIVWIDISIEFIVGLPKYRNKFVAMMVVYKISKYAHLCALQHPFKDSTVAQVFLDKISRLHGMTQSTILD